MTFDERVQAVVRFGFMERQARFLVMVMLHAGVCVLRQYSAFAGIVHGEKTRKFFGKLVRLGLASTYDCAHNRARVYHIRHKALYKAIGKPEHRHRRPVPLGRAIERLMLLDAVLADPDVEWKTSTDEKAQCLRALLRVPANSFTDPVGDDLDVASHKLPFGMQVDGRPVFLYLVTSPDLRELRTFVQRQFGLLASLATWTLRIVLPPHLELARAGCETIIQQQLKNPLAPSIVRELRWCFEQRRALAKNPALDVDRERFDHMADGFNTPRFQTLYSAWLAHGDTIFESLSSSVLADAVNAGSGRLELLVLPFRYTHLSPLVGIS